MIDYNLMHKANPLLFAPERYDQYPLNHQELMQYLTSASSSGATVCPRPVTATDEFDYLLYMDGNSSNRSSASPEHLTNMSSSAINTGVMELDLDKKLACEFAIYQTHMRNKQNDISGKNDNSHKAKKFNELLQMKVGSNEWFDEMLHLLESINATNIDLSSIGDMTIATKDNSLRKKIVGDGQVSNNTDGIERTDTTGIDLQDTISYIMSNAIKNGVDIKPQFKETKSEIKNHSNEKEYLRNIIDSMIEMAKINRDKVTNITEDKEADNVKMKEMNTALNDLQLAHNFLTRQFESDRIEYSKDIEKLTKTNRELQEKLLNYHSNLTKTENELHETQEKLQMKELNPVIEGNNTPLLKGLGDDLGFLSPITVDPDNIRSSQSSFDSKGEPKSDGKGSSYSLTLMRNEFKKLLTETQRKYETELAKERELRQELEKKQLK
ncbi:similar to Saccharomyces cerevisiae YER149C PEA2 Coiled-coil polarisome protein required for polarized morphogenesis, cell fusion, and low affinity Ca2+ influx [Maudiozyma saulgeensis]|uniref:Similar to Saccharomyces cerevisiae YER149C PEA2 Coiled-coil polarisome protein required for polarized morphogenesis, cell fusion, and low affinity Ca2+ influx n=1 Tax=Maudiozyma saulgeensis TaxID=1789683 RepID=A0A1X7R7U8_9SACH|nr:similar to Saccharomyces cerevisiae YER149C PEA2 Coiled-coil polarisome protein required for polarized morphogenesis, cell fusion, and low affinity Ca2+ influx [Kazachstania saulgeensis]